MDERLKTALHYVIHSAQVHNLNLDTVKLLKTIVFADVFSFTSRSRTVVNTRIIKATYGPAPDGWQAALESLEKEGRIKTFPRTQQYEITKYESLLSPDLAGFDVDDLHVLDTVTRAFCENFTATYLSRISHNHFWNITPMGEELPLGGYLPGDQVKHTPDELRRISVDMKTAGLFDPGLDLQVNG